MTNNSCPVCKILFSYFQGLKARGRPDVPGRTCDGQEWPPLSKLQRVYDAISLAWSRWEDTDTFKLWFEYDPERLQVTQVLRAGIRGVQPQIWFKMFADYDRCWSMSFSFLYFC